jgi:GWxTD domain-containing protein
MAVSPAKGSAPLSIDSIFVLPAGQYFSPDKQGLYLFQADSSGTSGVSLVVTDRQYPEPREITDLTEPLIYISTRREFETLKEDLSNKQALDKFWLSTLESPETARAAIKSYYQNVEEANLLFTSYKEGWKTDRGMIYIILGRPITVKKGPDTEIWSYLDIDGDEINFQFNKVSNIFSNNHYELFRDKSYDRTWFIAIDRWREGRIQ